MNTKLGEHTRHGGKHAMLRGVVLVRQRVVEAPVKVEEGAGRQVGGMAMLWIVPY
jgi:hypothetical protein